MEQVNYNIYINFIHVLKKKKKNQIKTTLSKS